MSLEVARQILEKTTPYDNVDQAGIELRRAELYIKIAEVEAERSKAAALQNIASAMRNRR